MILQRHVSHYIITYYLPSGLFVVVSWISFLVPPDVIPGKNITNFNKNQFWVLHHTTFKLFCNCFNKLTAWEIERYSKEMVNMDSTPLSSIEATFPKMPFNFNAPFNVWFSWQVGWLCLWRCSWFWSTSSTTWLPTLPRLRDWQQLRPGCWPAYFLYSVLWLSTPQFSFIKWN